MTTSTADLLALLTPTCRPALLFACEIQEAYCAGNAEAKRHILAMEVINRLNLDPRQHSIHNQLIWQAISEARIETFPAFLVWQGLTRTFGYTELRAMAISGAKDHLKELSTQIVQTALPFVLPKASVELLVAIVFALLNSAALESNAHNRGEFALACAQHLIHLRPRAFLSKSNLIKS
jgi:hypothetical protein